MMAGSREAATTPEPPIERDPRERTVPQAGSLSIAMNCLMAGDNTLFFL